MNFEITYFFYAALGSVLVGLSKGGLPSTGMLAVPILSLSISPIHATTLLLPIYIISMRWVSGLPQKLQCLQRQNTHARRTSGVFVGWLTATVISEVVVTFLIGLIGISFCLNSWLRKVKMLNPNNRKPCQVCFGVLWLIYKFHLARRCATFSGLCTSSKTFESRFCWHRNFGFCGYQSGQNMALSRPKTLPVGRSDGRCLSHSFCHCRYLCRRYFDQENSGQTFLSLGSNWLVFNFTQTHLVLIWRKLLNEFGCL